MPLKFYTAQYRYSGPDRLDITVKGQDPIGKMFAPTWAMVMGLKDGKLSWLDYCMKYADMMVESFIANQQKWLDMVNQEDTITFVCFCANPKSCHRHLLAVILQQLGAVYMGERKL